MVFLLKMTAAVSAYNELCRKCQHECKQSFRAVVVDCPKSVSKRSKKKDKTAGNGKIP